MHDVSVGRAGFVGEILIFCIFFQVECGVLLLFEALGAKCQKVGGRLLIKIG